MFPSPNQILPGIAVPLQTLRPHTAGCLGYTNPVVDSDNPDPAVTWVPEAGLYLAATTHGDQGAAFSLLTSPDLVTWVGAGHVFPAGEWPAYCATNMWAPEIHSVNGRSVTCSA